MKIKDFIKALVSKLNIGELIDAIRNMRKTLKEVDIPLWATAAKELKQLKNPKAKKFEELIGAKCKGVYRGPLVGGVFDAVKNAQLILDYLEELVSTEFNHFSQEILKDGITFKKANVLQYVDTIDFLMTYSRRLCELLYVLEANQKSPAAQRVEDAFTPADLEYFDKNIEAFAEALRIASFDIKSLMTAFNEIPDAIANGESEAVMASTVGLNKIDPIGFRNFVSTSSPVYHISMWIAERQVRKYQDALETKKLVELRLLKLRDLKEGGEAPANIEKQIEYQQARLDKITREIRKLEEKYV